MKNNELMFNGKIIGSSFTLEESNTIVFSINNEKIIKMNKDGFYIKGKLVKKDNEIYLAFKEWIDKTNNLK